MSKSAKIVCGLALLFVFSEQAAVGDPVPENNIFRAKRFLGVFYPALDDALTPVSEDHNRLGDPDPRDSILNATRRCSYHQHGSFR